jgi:hypothetical protein
MLRHFLSSAPTGCRCRFLQTNQGGKYKNTGIAKLLLKHSIMHEMTSLHTPKHNRVAEQFNRTALDMVHCMLLNSGLPKNLWGEALFAAMAINNRLPSQANDNATLIERWDPTNSLKL